MPWTVNPDHGYLERFDTAASIDAVLSFTTDISGPVLPTAGGVVDVTGTNVFSDGSVANTLTLNVQGVDHALLIGNGPLTPVTSLAVGTSGQVLIAATGGDPAFSTITSNDGSVSFTLGANALDLSVPGGTTVVTKLSPQTGTDPVSPVGGIIQMDGGTVVAGTNPVRTNGTAGDTLTVQVQISQALAAGDPTKIGLANFDSADFAVSADGFVQLAGAGAGQTITGDSGGALSPTAGNWNIFGRSGSKTSGSGSTLTVNSPPYANQAGSTSVTLNSGSFATAAITLTTPVTAGLADGDLLEFVATNGVLVIQLAATQVAHLGNISTSAAGTITSTLTGDSLSFRYQASTNDWWATSVIGTWVLA